MKHLIFQLLLTLIFLTNNILSQKSDRPKVGLVLSGGGAKGFAHIGVLRIFEVEGIPIDYIAGTSIGSIIGGLYAIGYNSGQLEAFVTNQEWANLLSDYISRDYKNIFEKYDQDRYLISFKLKTDEGIRLPAGVVEGHNIMNKLCELTAKYHEVRDFNKFPIPFACVAADIATGEEVVIKEGFLPEAIFASMSIPTIFAPSVIHDKLVVDGGITNNFPADVVKDMGADIIIGVDIQSEPLKREDIGDLTDILGQLVSFLGSEKYERNKLLCDVILKPEISEFGTGSFSNSAADSLIKLGEKAAHAKIDEIKEILSANNVPRKKVEREYKFDSQFQLNNFMVEGINNTSVDFLLKKSNLNFPQEHNFASLSAGIKKLYGSDNFRKAYYRLLLSEGETLRLVVSEKTTSSLNAGFNFNSKDKASILLNLTFRNEIAKGTRLSFDAKLAQNLMFGTYFQFSHPSLPEISLKSVYRTFNLEYYNRTAKISEADIRYLNSEFSIFGIVGDNYLANVGIRSEYFRFIPFDFDEDIYNLNRSEKTVLSGFVNLRFENFNDKYYPTSGLDLSAEFSYASNEANNLIENSTTPILLYNLKSAISPLTDITVLPSFYGRLLLNDNSATFRSNMLGGPEVTQLLDYQLPFIGLERAVILKDKLFVGKLEFRGRLADDNYLSLIANIATDFNKFKDWRTREIIGGYGLKFSHNSFIGPIDLILSTSDYTDEIDFFLNVGRWF